jgi:crotonobetainyl-CoA:carnitine CoA-transferase CaiB-like acyl-CoA transferase
VASPLRLMDTPPVLRRAPPLLGEHTDEVLAGLGLDAAAIAQLRISGVV